MKGSICLIEINNNCGTGFFIKLPIPSKETPMYGLMTNNHVLDSKCIKPGNSFSICLNKFKKKIFLNESNFIFTSEFIDVTFIQLCKKDINDIELNNPYFQFLDPYLDRCNEEEKIYIFQYPERNLSYAEGKIESISGFNYFHIASTKGGSSGSPLLNNDMKVIGIHKAGIEKEKKNIGTKFNNIEYAIRTLYNKRNINNINKAREPTRELSEDEKKELKKHDLKETNIPNLYKCPYKKNPSLNLYFYRTNHAWYYTTKNKINNRNIKINHWNLINAYEPFTSYGVDYIYKNIRNIKLSHFNLLKETISHPDKMIDEMLEHHHELIIMWLKLSELMYM